MELLTEDQVVISLIKYLKHEDWIISSYCLGNKRGYDIVAQKEDRTIYVEAKGAKGNPLSNNTVRKKFDSGQLKDHLGKAIVKSFECQNRFPKAIVAIAHHNDDYIKNIIGDKVKNLNKAGIWHFWVDLNGRVLLEK